MGDKRDSRIWKISVLECEKTEFKNLEIVCPRMRTKQDFRIREISVEECEKNLILESEKS